jgi:8-oxo-dGTP pyrophosphatase MutT (NUDIX family)
MVSNVGFAFLKGQYKSMQSLSSIDLARLKTIQDELGAGDIVTTSRWKELESLQIEFAEKLGISHEQEGAWEEFRLIRDQEGEKPLVAPRWWFHLTGLRHGASHVVLTTPQGWFIVQRRHRSKDDSPGALDIAVTGHIGITDPLSAAWRELHEEIGLRPADIINQKLTYLTVYDKCDDRLVNANPPFFNRERLWVYSGQVTAEGLAHLRFTDGEVISLLFLGESELYHLADRCNRGERHIEGDIDLATGILYTLPLWMQQIRIQENDL